MPFKFVDHLVTQINTHGLVLLKLSLEDNLSFKTRFGNQPYIFIHLEFAIFLFIVVPKLLEFPKFFVDYSFVSHIMNYIK